MKSRVLRTVVFGVLFFAASAAVRAASSVRPNIVILLADDMGYGDLSSFGSRDIKTPAIDSIARGGVRLTQFYANSPECTPSRTALLTGRYQQRVGGLECAIGLGNVGRYDEAEWLQKRGELGLPPSEKTLPRWFNDAGYATAIFGKWHLGYDPKFAPKVHGFQESLVVLGGGTDYVTHAESDGAMVMRVNGEAMNVPGYLTDVFADRAVDWITRQGTKPYFLYVPFNAPHDPYQGPGDGPAPVPWAKGNRDVYRQMVEHMDKRIGDVLAAIDRSPGGKNTLVVFLSDNGGTAVADNGGFRGHKTTMWEGGIRVPCVIRWPAEIPSGGETNQVAQNIDLSATLLAAAGITPGARQLDGMNLMGTLQGKTPSFPRTVFWRYKRGDARRKAIRDGDYKLVIDNAEKELLNIAKDPQEKTNLLASMPEKAAALEAKIIAWEKEVAAPRLKDFVAQPPTGKAAAPPQ